MLNKYILLTNLDGNDGNEPIGVIEFDKDFEGRIKQALTQHFEAGKANNK